MDNLLRFNNKQKYLVFDTETEGLNLVWHRPYQLSWIIAEGKNEISRHDYYLWFPDLKMSEAAARVTGFNWDTYKSKAVEPHLAYDKFKEMLYDPSVIPVCQNLFNFDCYIIKDLQRILGETIDYSYIKRSVDTKAVATAMMKGLKFDPNLGNDFLAWQYSMASIVEKGVKTGQETLLKHFEIPYEKERLHEALYDVQMLFEIFKKLIWTIEVPNLIGGNK